MSLLLPRSVGPVFVSLLLLIPVTTSATTWHVPSQCLTIQAGVNSASAGDTVLVASGTYTGDGNRDVNFGGKDIVVVSQAGFDFTIIDCGGTPEEPHRGFRFDSGETPAAVLDGFTITGGFGRFGGAVYCSESSPTISNCMFSYNAGVDGGGVSCRNGSFSTLSGCVFLGNHSYEEGGGLYCRVASVSVAGVTFQDNTANAGGGAGCHESGGTFMDCMFLGNAANATGGGFFYLESSTSITGCTFSGNSAELYGGGITCEVQSSPYIVCCTLYGNSAEWGGGIFCQAGVHGTIENTVVAFSPQGAGVFCWTGGRPTMACCDVFGNAGGDWITPIASWLGTNGNICTDPLFCGPDHGDFTIRSNSTCAPFSLPNPECDLIGAWPVGCTGTAVVEQAPMTWSGLKALYR